MNEPRGTRLAALANGRSLLSTRPAAALEQAQVILKVTPGDPDALLLAAHALRQSGRSSEAADHERRHVAASLRRPQLHEANAAIAKGDRAVAERLIREVLKSSPDDVAANIMLGDLASHLGIYEEAERLVQRAVAAAPGLSIAKISLATILFQRRQIEAALDLLDEVADDDAVYIRATTLKADIYAQTGAYDDAADAYRTLLNIVGDSRPDIWLWYGNLLKTVGQQDDAIAAYRKALALDPSLSEGWWSLTEMKVKGIDDDDLESIQCALASSSTDAKRVFLHFALGKAFEDRKRWRESFYHYNSGNRLRRLQEPYDAADISQQVDRSIALYQPSFFDSRSSAGSSELGPIFVLGMPRAGSTLVEQILSSHSQIEGVSELQDIPWLVQDLVAQRWQERGARYPDVVADLNTIEIRAVSERYLASAANHRQTTKPFFIDKLPNNWLYTGLIHLILPNAKIIDARRDALSCCFSNFKQLFAKGQSFSYSLQDTRAYYKDYVRMMDHINRVMPNRVHRIVHEELIDDPEREVRRMLNYIGVSFEPGCLDFHHNNRPVRTASSEQVRRPINRDAVDRWRHYLPWIGDLQQALIEEGLHIG